MTRTAGSMTDKCIKKEYVIAISSRLNEVLGNRLNSGIRVNGPIDAFIITLQHEITHLIVYLEMDRLGIRSSDLTDPTKVLPISASALTSHGIIFQDIGERFFGLTERTHRLFEAEVEVVPVIERAQLSIGTRVYFDSKTQRIYARITKLNPKRAVVQPEDTNRSDKVPYEMLHIV